MNNLIKEMNLTDLKIAALGSIGLYVNLSDFNTIIGTLTGVVILGYTLSRWYYLVKENQNKEDK